MLLNQMLTKFKQVLAITLKLPEDIDIECIGSFVSDLTPRAARYFTLTEWEYFTPTGSRKCTNKFPCFGYWVKGKSCEYAFPNQVFVMFLMYSLLVKKDGNKHTDFAKWYLGISLGPPAYSTFDPVLGIPSQPTDPKAESMVAESVELSKDFRNRFMTTGTLVFTGADGATKVTGNPEIYHDHEVLRETIKKILRPGWHSFKINFYGVFTGWTCYKSNPKQKWHFFEFYGGHKECSTADPCIGFRTDECEYSLLNLIFSVFLI
jgi:hypothetical protein